MLDFYRSDNEVVLGISWQGPSMTGINRANIGVWGSTLNPK